MQDHRMDPARFEALAQAYGGDLDRWPTDERSLARAFQEAEPARALAVLADAEDLDGLLSAAPDPVFSGILRETLIRSASASASAAAPTADRRAPSGRQAPAIRRAPFRWVSGLGLAAACAAGVVFGASLSPTLFGDPGLESLEQASTAFDATLSFDAEEIAG